MLLKQTAAVWNLFVDRYFVGLCISSTAVYKVKLSASVRTHTLFDTKRFTKGLRKNI